ncbi:MAG: ATP-dependent DNA helicase [Candidatus Beckwithbacteria bacterium]
MKLNPNQQLAVDTIDGPVMVIAGPGTGKTQIIAERIAQILKKTDTAPDSILALSFTESGVKAMRERLIATIGATAYYVNIFTFHSFCSSVIQEFPDKFIISPQVEPLSDLERVQIFQTIIDSLNLDYLKPAHQPYFYIPSLIQAIQDLKREAVSPDDLKALITDPKAAKLPELVKIYRRYQKALAEVGRYDFEDMINLVAQAFKADSELLLTFQERFHYFLVDEYQDTNSAQNQVVNLLASYWGDQANVFVVGDINQSIFKFQGASLENVIGFTKTYPRTKIITLDQNYRSTQTILTASHHLIQNNHFHIESVVNTAKTKLTSQKTHPEKPLYIIKLPSEIIETYWIAQKIKKLINQGVKAESIAVLYRHNADAAGLADIFAKLHIPVDIEGGANILEDPTIIKLLTLLKAISLSPSSLEDLDLFTLLHYEFLHLDSLDILKLSRQASQSNTSIIDLILSTSFPALKLKSQERILDFIRRLASWQQLDSQLNFSQFFETLVKQSGFFDWLISCPDALEKLNRLNSLFSAIKRLNQADHQLNLHSFLNALQLMELNHLKLAETDLDIKTKAVTLTTAHKAKGKEWEYVFIIKAIDGKWGNNRTREMIKLPSGILKYSQIDKKEKNEDERRLFYVCLTRAKKKLYLTFADRYARFGHSTEAVPTMFISELPQPLVKTLQPKSLNPQTILTLSFSAPSAPRPTLVEADYFNFILNGFKLSPTALNTYLTCPYKFKLNNLIRVPRAKQTYFSFGTAVHKALELFHRQFIKNDKHPAKQFLIDQFGKALAKEVLTASELKLMLKKGQKLLSFYYDYYQDNLVKPLFTEKFFGYGMSKTYLDDIPLAGKIDRIDLLSVSKKTVKVVDYKTGSPKSRNQILGKTQEANADYYRQLVFYRLLSQLDRSFKLKVSEAELEFVEPTPSGKLKKENFIISDQDVADLKETIRQSMKAIRCLNFSKTSTYSHCLRCEYLNHCWPEGLPQPG